MVDAQLPTNDGGEGETRGLATALTDSAGRVRRKAMAAMAAIAVVGVYDALLGVVGFAHPTAMFVAVAQLLSWVPTILGAVFFCQWLYAAYKQAAALGSPVLGFSASDAVVSFFIPIVNVYKPFQVLRAVFVASDPSALPDPPQYRLRAGEADYRASAGEPVPSPVWRLPFPIVGWWLAYIGAPIVLMLAALAAMFGASAAALPESFGLVTSVTKLAATGFAIQLVRAIDARQVERLRRIELGAARVSSEQSRHS